MTTAQKKKLLQMPSIRGELLITNEYGNRMIYPFGDVFNYRREHCKDRGCIMIGKSSDHYINCHDNKHMLIWDIGYGGTNLSCKIQYKHVHILWCIYKGENNFEEK